MHQAASTDASQGALKKALPDGLPGALLNPLVDAAWGFLLAGLLALVLLFMGSEDRGFIYVDF